MQKRLGVSGTGRIGRLVIRSLFMDGDGASLGLINSTCAPDQLVHLLKYDSIHGRWDVDMKAGEQCLFIQGHRIPVVSERRPELLPWREHGIDVVVDATGKFKSRSEASLHMEAGAKRVVVTAPGKDLDCTIVMGVNEHAYNPQQHALISTASCTTNCLAPLLHVLDQEFGLDYGWMTTVHAYTNDQKHLDNSHSDWRRGRACGSSIIPTSTGVGKALKDILPHLAERVQGISLRVPVQNVSLVDLTAGLHSEVTKEDIVRVFTNAIREGMEPYLEYNEEPLVSSDYIGNRKSAIIDGLSIQTSGHQVKLLAWYDNEWAYACRVTDFVKYMFVQSEEVEPTCETKSMSSSLSM
ncbi:type I glyceraldehyde-3-phosphate dehydrogenase [Paenibacillus alvei]|uniref:Glyceraldehyde-3-phosphate dehydrogenase n=1 Tax=Paenibacillus alvei TaxID=44250 RepID=A0ABT4GZY4_PAEAL|nr:MULTISPECIES: type I glyceraldehyde-3-phosphate dehydrogenase [Paenibacillus]EJW15807.1 glyceraldehyde-3-phosphate dehydrogenase 2 [Paenibacillus alvei DSM 29]MCY7484574.1 type I glyceraldehyde-3-phosphate dehydrogenase [Paenibacillus alvei]MCY9542052.1 type I glyceraldehyde-3-phosphate dehydrogenase [Paenibacillus alvei]MCY9706220.1 type I glyceraldehyde-3-phosphate dehydrogenase [Paenibacillus alvei]MCY9735337.1 type I glyceraldehyde-3-phosphate dehydrogenase [Paenibacillus alvei]